jgi:hypothetical protein
MERLDGLVPVMRTFIRARDALTDAEGRQALDPEILALADVVVAARVALARGLLSIGWAAPPGVPDQLDRDAKLIEESVGQSDAISRDRGTN